MTLAPHLNPSPWRDQDEGQRIAVQREPISGVAAALRANFAISPLPEDLQKLVEKLR